jgi:hypothetical protein
MPERRRSGTRTRAQSHEQGLVGRIRRAAKVRRLKGSQSIGAFVSNVVDFHFPIIERTLLALNARKGRPRGPQREGGLLCTAEMLLRAHFGDYDLPVARLHDSVAVAEYLVHLARMFFNVFSEI